MNTTAPTTQGRLEHPSPPVPLEVEHTPRRVNLIDRAALHLGLALITWGRRSHPVSRERRARRYEQHLARLERERLAEREYRLGTPPR